MADIPNTDNEVVAKIAASMTIASGYTSSGLQESIESWLARFEKAYKKISAVIKEVDEQ